MSGEQYHVNFYFGNTITNSKFYRLDGVDDDSLMYIAVLFATRVRVLEGGIMCDSKTTRDMLLLHRYGYNLCVHVVCGNRVTEKTH